MAQISNQFAHIFIHYYSNKNSSACKLFISEPTQNQERLLGRLFGILEINTPNRENTQIISHLISNLENIYYGYAENENLNIYECFEKTLKEAGREFANLLRNKQVSLVGNLNENTIREKINLSIGVMKENELYFTYLNNINIYLIHKTKQDYKIIDIKKIAQEDSSEQEKNENTSLFANILSGEVNPPDFLIMANSNFTEYVSLERIQKIITSLPLHKATEYFKNSLLQFEGQNFAAIMVKNSITQNETGKEPASLTSITELNYTESLTEKLLAPSIWNIFKNEKDKIIKKIIQLRKDSNVDKIESNPEQNLNAPKETHDLEKKSPLFFSNYLFIIKKRFKNICNNSPRLNNIKNKLYLKLNILKNKITVIPSISKILLFIAVILLVLFIISIFYFKKQQTDDSNHQEYLSLIAQIEEKKNQAESDLIYGDEEKAKTEIAEAQTLLNKLPLESKKEKEAVENLTKAIWNIVAKLRHVEIVDSPVLIANLENIQESPLNIQNIIYADNKIFAFDSLSNTCLVISPENGEVKINHNNLTDLGAIIKVKQIENRIIAYHDKKGFIEFKDNKYSPVSITQATNSHIADFAAYNSRLYTVDVNNNQIYRQPKNENGYDLGITWLKQPGDLKDIIGMSIDTSIWLLDKKGYIEKYTKGNKQNFEIKNLEPLLESPAAIFTDDQTNHIYILEPKNSRIVVLDKSGNLITQYFNDNFTDLKALAVIEKDNKIFIVNGNNIYSFKLSHLK